MKQINKEKESVDSKTKKVVPPLPPPPLPLEKFWVRKATPESITKQEIARFWRQKRIDEEDHLLAAIKAAARIRAHNLSEEDYKRFEESLKYDDDDDDGTTEKVVPDANNSKESKNNEVRVGIKDCQHEQVDKEQVCILEPTSYWVNGYSREKNFNLHTQLLHL